MLDIMHARASLLRPKWSKNKSKFATTANHFLTVAVVYRLLYTWLYSLVSAFYIASYSYMMYAWVGL